MKDVPCELGQVGIFFSLPLLSHQLSEATSIILGPFLVGLVPHLLILRNRMNRDNCLVVIHLGVEHGAHQDRQLPIFDDLIVEICHAARKHGFDVARVVTQ